MSSCSTSICAPSSLRWPPTAVHTKASHVNADQLILECLDDDGRPVEPGTPGVVVVTSLYGFVMPFIRFRLGDICTPIEQRCSCGSSFPLVSAPLGRQDDVLRLPSGKLLAPVVWR